jgi:hypothetical protein
MKSFHFGHTSFCLLIFLFSFVSLGEVCGVIICYVMSIDRLENFVVEQNQTSNEEILVTFWQILCMEIFNLLVMSF